MSEARVNRTPPLEESHANKLLGYLNSAPNISKDPHASAAFLSATMMVGFDKVCRRLELLIEAAGLGDRLDPYMSADEAMERVRKHKKHKANGKTK